HGQALPRGDPRPRDVGWSALLARLHVDEERAAAARPDHEGAQALGASQEAGAPAATRDAGVPGWVETCLAAAGPELDLIVTMDDATSAMLSAFLVEEE